MKERPILFSAPMVRALLEGRKTQTRRVVKGMALEWLKPGMFTREVVASPENHLCPYGQPGEALWVKETSAHHVQAIGATRDKDGPFVYAADGEIAKQHRLGDKWKPSIFMPRRASRILLEITAVRVERLQDINEADAIAEGVEHISDEGPNCYSMNIGDYSLNAPTAAATYAYLWDCIKGTGSWDANPWVWVVEFKRIES
jgi:hypothetical protein